MSSCKNHRLVECFGLEGTFEGHLGQPPCTGQGYLQLDEVAQSPFQLRMFLGMGLLLSIWTTRAISTTLTVKIHLPE